jgi:AraC-like DNA-binding protein
MTAPFLLDFATQITAWAQTFIDDGRYPFRRTEVYSPPLLSAPTAPPTMVLWINRDSFMAGGILIFTDTSSALDDAVGPEIAAALGLSHFTVWGRKHITFWQCANGKAVVHKDLPVTLPATPAPGDFHALLLRVLQELKLLCVTATLPSSALSPRYFANIFHTTMAAALPALRREYRLQQAETPLQHHDSIEYATELKAYLSLLRLVALAAFDRLPPAVQPEGLEQASRFALETLPSSAHLPLAIGQQETPLGKESAIRFHHLFRRLTQLGIAGDRQRIARALELLLPGCATRFGGFPLTTSLPETTAGSTTLLLNPDRPLAGSRAVEIASSPLCAFFAVIRTLRNTSPPQQQTTTPLLLGAELCPVAIIGTLYDKQIPTGHARLVLNTRLRTSWPGRRWGLPPGTPHWVWELLHVCGIAAANAHIDLSLPGGWLSEPFAKPLLEMLFEELTIVQFAEDPTSGLRLELRKEPAAPQTIITIGGAQDRHLPRMFFDPARSSMLAMALSLPQEILALLLDGTLKPCPSGPLTEAQRRGAELFCRSSLGERLWDLIAPGSPLPGGEIFFDRLAERGMPLPAENVLAQLAASFPPGPDLPTISAIDRELGRWFDVSLLALTTTTGSVQKGRLQRRIGSRTAGALEERIVRKVFCDGIPRFPEHYLLDHFRPATHAYELSGPLAVRTTFFDSIYLEDAHGDGFEVEGMETAQALVLASHCNSGAILLPTDRQLTAALLARYLKDLQRLRQRLRQQVYLEVPDPRQADALCSKIWAQQALPPATLLDR